LQRGLNHDDVIDHRLGGLKDHVKLPAATTALVNNQLSLSLERLQRLKSHRELEWLHRGFQGFLFEVKGHRSFNKLLLLGQQNVDFVMERIVFEKLLESRQL